MNRIHTIDEIHPVYAMPVGLSVAIAIERPVESASLDRIGADPMYICIPIY